MNIKINHIAVWILVIVDQVIGGVWYSHQLFADKWMQYHGRTMADIEPNKGDPTPFIIAIVAAIILNYALAWLFRRLNVASAISGLKIALICWLAFLFVDYATISAFSAFGRNFCHIILIDMGRTFLTFAIAGLLLGGWRRKSVVAAAL